MDQSSEKDLNLANVISRSLTTVLRYSCNDKFRTKCFQAFGVSNSDEFQDACGEIVLSSITPLVPLSQTKQHQTIERRTAHDSDMEEDSPHEAQSTSCVLESASLTQDNSSSQCAQSSIRNLSQTSEAPILSQLLHFDDVGNEYNNSSQVPKNNNTDDTDLLFHQYVMEAFEINSGSKTEDNSFMQSSKLLYSKQKISPAPSTRLWDLSQSSQQEQIKKADIVTLKTNPRARHLHCNVTDYENGLDIACTNDKMITVYAQPTTSLNNNEAIIPNLDSEQLLKSPQCFPQNQESAPPLTSMLLNFDDRMDSCVPVSGGIWSEVIHESNELSQIKNVEEYSSLSYLQQEASLYPCFDLTRTHYKETPPEKVQVDINQNLKSIKSTKAPCIETSDSTSNDAETGLTELHDERILNMTYCNVIKSTSAAAMHNNDTSFLQSPQRQQLTPTRVLVQQDVPPTLSQVLDFKKTTGITLDTTQRRKSKSIVENNTFHRTNILYEKGTLHLGDSKKQNCEDDTSTEKQNHKVSELQQSKKCENSTHIDNEQSMPPAFSQLLHFSQNIQFNTRLNQTSDSDFTAVNSVQLNKPNNISNLIVNECAWNEKHTQTNLFQQNHQQTLLYEQIHPIVSNNLTLQQHSPSLFELIDFNEENSQEVIPHGSTSGFETMILNDNNENNTNQKPEDSFQVSDENLAEETQSVVSYDSSTSSQLHCEGDTSTQSTQITNSQQSSSTPYVKSQDSITGVYVTQPVSPILTELLLF